MTDYSQYTDDELIQMQQDISTKRDALLTQGMEISTQRDVLLEEGEEIQVELDKRGTGEGAMQQALNG